MRIRRYDENIHQLALRVTRLERLANVDHYGRDLLRCCYYDCRESHPLAIGDERVTCPTCRDELGLDRIPTSMTSNQAASPVSSTAAAADADKEDAMTSDPVAPDPPASPPSPTPLNQVIMAQLMEFISNKVMTMYEAPDHVQHFDPIQPMLMPGVGRVGYTCRIWYRDEDRWMKSMVLSLRDEEAVKVGIQLAKADVQLAITEREEKMGSVDDE